MPSFIHPPISIHPYVHPANQPHPRIHPPTTCPPAHIHPPIHASMEHMLCQALAPEMGLTPGERHLVAETLMGQGSPAAAGEERRHAAQGEVGAEKAAQKGLPKPRKGGCGAQGGRESAEGSREP